MPTDEERQDYADLLHNRRTALSAQLAPILAANPRFLWEVGSGHGHFLTAYAAAHPEKTCIGIDLVGERIERSERKRERARLPNLHFIRAEARFFLDTLPPEARLTEVFILFPDPWPKARHHKHRILQPSFLKAVAARAEPSCRIYFRTDFDAYYSEAASTVQESAEWERVDAPWPFEFETVFQSRAESHQSIIAQLRPGRS